MESLATTKLGVLQISKSANYFCMLNYNKFDPTYRKQEHHLRGNDSVDTLMQEKHL